MASSTMAGDSGGGAVWIVGIIALIVLIIVGYFIVKKTDYFKR